MVDRKQKPQDTGQPRPGPERHQALGRNKKSMGSICLVACVVARASWVLRVGS